MGRSRKPQAYLDYPLFPRRRRPWRGLLLAGAVVGVLAFFSWGWLLGYQLGYVLPLAASHRARAVSVTPTSIVPPISAERLTSGDTQADLSVIPMLISPTITLSPPPTVPISPTESALVDDVNEVEASWAERAGRAQIITYTVQPGDTMWSIANQFGLDVDTLRWSNPDLERNPDKLSVGMQLIVLPVVGIYHTVELGETLSGIAQRFGVAEVDILNYPLNQIKNADELLAGQRLVIPYGHQELAHPVPQLSPASPLAWPLVGTITQGFSDAHPALDIGAPYGSPVFAGAAGRVSRSGWARTGYGYTVVIDHGQGLESLYSHMKGSWVQAGDWVKRGQLIGEVGSTGHSSGPHVHMEVRLNGEQVNPIEYLPAGGPR